jgi:S-adenosylmethionine/arginine decarboxylase-like enzyme
MQAKMWNVSGWVDETDPELLKSKYNGVLKASGFGVLAFSEHYFTPYGYSSMWLLSESHFALHTFPEENKTYFELSSCVEAQYRKFIEFENIKIKKDRQSFPEKKALEKCK